MHFKQKEFSFIFGENKKNHHWKKAIKRKKEVKNKKFVFIWCRPSVVCMYKGLKRPHTKIVFYPRHAATGSVIRIITPKIRDSSLWWMWD